MLDCKRLTSECKIFICFLKMLISGFKSKRFIETPRTYAKGLCITTSVKHAPVVSVVSPPSYVGDGIPIQIDWI